MPARKSKYVDFKPEELKRYARHLSLPGIGIEGQKKLKRSSVLCVGTGGLGSPVLLYLAAAGIGHIGIVDSDSVEDSNLQRQIIHGTSSIGKPKIESARLRILELNPFCKVDIYHTHLTTKNALDIIKAYDIVCDCTDNFASKYLINDACIILNKPSIYGSIAFFEGHTTVFNLKNNSPNLRDLIPTPPPNELLPTCEEGGVFGVLPGIIGVIQATEVIKIITGSGKPLDGRLLVFDALKMEFKELKLNKNVSQKAINKLIDYQTFCENKNNLNNNSISSISAKDLQSKLEKEPNKILLLDVRTASEFEMKSIKHAILMPLQKIQNGEAIASIKKMAYGKELYAHCKSGKRSLQALKILKSHNIEGINLTGGIEAWDNNL